MANNYSARQKVSLMKSFIPSAKNVSIISNAVPISGEVDVRVSIFEGFRSRRFLNVDH